MATSGTIKTNTEYDSYFWIKWSQKSQSVENNSTTINWSCGVYCGHNFYSNAVRMSAVSINGTQVYAGGTYSNYNKGDHTIATGTLSISHNTDGTKSFTISAFTGWLYSDHDYSASAQSYSLTQIPRKATITSAPNFNDNDNPTIYYSNPLGFYVAELSACISLTGSLADVAYRDISKTGNSYTFNLTDAERAVLRNATTGNPPKRSVLFVVRTKLTSGSSYVTHTATKEFTVQETSVSKPVDSIAVSPVSSLPSQFNGLYVQGKTKAAVAHTASFKYSAAAAAYSTSIDGKTYSDASFTSDYINTAGAISVKGSVTDSRGFKSAETENSTKTINVLPYSKPYVAPLNGLSDIVCTRCTSDGTISPSGTYLKVRCSRKYAGVNGINKCLLQLRYKTDSASSYGDWITLIAKTDTADSFDGIVSGIGLNISTVYNIQIEAVDDIGETSVPVNFSIPTDVVPLHLGEGGKNVGIGRYANMESSERVDVAWDSYFEKGVSVSGNIAFENGEQTAQRNIIFKNENGTYPHNCQMYGGNPGSPTGIGMWDSKNNKRIIVYDDVENLLYLGNSDSTINITGRELQIQCTARIITDMTLLSNLPSGFSGYGRAITFGTNIDTDMFVLLIDSNRKLYVGTKLNGASTITWSTH